jgi:membrane protein DedA with SNARE-associated domain
MNLPQFLTAVVIGRTIRYSMWGILAVLCGNSLKRYMQQNLNRVGMVLLGCFAIVIVGSIAFYWRRMKESRSEKGL